jgi:hypothetical protein
MAHRPHQLGSVGTLSPADVMIERIGDLLSLDLSRLHYNH